MDDKLRQLEKQLMREMDERILAAEEAALMKRIDRNIRRAEAKEKERSIVEQLMSTKHHPLPWAHLDDPAHRTAVQKRRRARERAEKQQKQQQAGTKQFPRGLCYDPSSVHGLEFVKVTKLLPRRLGARWKTRQLLEDYFVRKFRTREGAELLKKEPAFAQGFHLRLRSANANSWRLEVQGYRPAVDLLFQCLARMFNHAIQKQQQREQQQQQKEQQQQQQRKEHQQQQQQEQEQSTQHEQEEELEDMADI